MRMNGELMSRSAIHSRHLVSSYETVPTVKKSLSRLDTIGQELSRICISPIKPLDEYGKEDEGLETATQ